MRERRGFKKGLATCCLSGIAMAAAISMPQSANAWRYVPGALGINSAVLPPPGFHYVSYNMFYNADTLKDNSGNSQDIGFDIGVYAEVNHFVYVTDYKLLGGDFGIDALVPLVYTDLQIDAAGVDEDEFGIGDITLEPFCLIWHGARYDAGYGLALITPTGDTDNAASPGKGYYSIMNTAGVNLYADEARSWSFSVMTRWLYNFEDPDTDVTDGAEVVAEYGIGKSLPIAENLIFRTGVAGYSALQLTDDDGPGTDSDEQRQVHAVGPDVFFMWLGPIPLQLEMRYMFEYGAESYSEGQTATVTLRASF